MISGGILAALAGTATVCASLAYLKPTEEESCGTTLAEDIDDTAAVGNQPSAAAREERGAGGEERRRGGSVETPNSSSRRRPEKEGSRLTNYGTGLRRMVAMLTPNASARNMVSFLFCFFKPPADG